jgi:hypothetical protein
VQLILIAWYVLYWDKFPKYSARRLTAWFVLLFSVIAVVPIQLEIHEWITPVAKIEDNFLFAVIVLEGLASAGLLLYLLWRRRLQQRQR